MTRICKTASKLLDLKSENEKAGTNDDYSAKTAVTEREIIGRNIT